MCVYIYMYAHKYVCEIYKKYIYLTIYSSNIAPFYKEMEQQRGISRIEQ